MCGIAGVISEAPLTEGDKAALRALNGGMIHRGPNSDGFFFDDHVGLAMRRLSIVDLESGHQPIFNAQNTSVIVCNGEIYNHKELRPQLIGRGAQFRTHSDIENIVHLYDEKGAHCVDDLRGMYAFAIWDSIKKQLVLGRDRLGEKPLYLLRHRTARGAKQLWFASELSQLMRLLPQEARALDPNAIALYLTFQYSFEPETLIKGIECLPAGATLTLSPQKLDARPHTYWTLLDVPAGSRDTPVDDVKRLFRQACLRMGSADVPVGVSLSGGIDSSLVAAVSAQCYPGQLHAFSVGYPGRPATDERAIAKAFAAQLGLPFTEIEISIDDVVRDFEELVKGMDVPVADPAAYGYYSVCKAARSAGVPVLLSGIGGDELFWGYDWVRNAVGTLTAQGQRQVPAGNLLSRLFGSSKRGADTFSPYEFHPVLTLDAERAHAMLGRPNALDPRNWISRTLVERDAQADLGVLSVLNNTWLLSNCLTLMDRMSMAHSIEMRVPFLDIDLTTAVIGMRRSGMDDWRQAGKQLLLEAYGNLLPNQITQRPKQGFTPPVQDWLIAIEQAHRPDTLDDYELVRRGIADRTSVERTHAGADPFFRYKSTLLNTWIKTAFAHDTLAA